MGENPPPGVALGHELDQKSGLAFINELLPATVDLLRGRVSFDIRHFSGYLVSWH